MRSIKGLRGLTLILKEVLCGLNAVKQHHMLQGETAPEKEVNQWGKLLWSYLRNFTATAPSFEQLPLIQSAAT